MLSIGDLLDSRIYQACITQFSLFLDQAFFGPANVLFFFVASGVLEQQSSADIYKKLDSRLLETIKSAWVFWVLPILLERLMQDSIPIYHISWEWPNDFVLI